VKDPDREHIVAGFVATALGRDVARVRRLDAFATNEVYEVDAGAERLIVKATTHDALRAEAWACARGRRAGFAAPAILGVAALDARTSALIMPRISGTPVEGKDPTLTEVGARLRLLHAETVPRFGVLAETAWSERGDFTLEHESWLDYLHAICAGARALAHIDATATRTAEAAAAAIDARADAFAAIDVGSLCHGDLKAAHILVDSGRLAGVIDWGDAVVGDPLWDVARYAHRADAESLALLLDGYDPSRSLASTLAWCLPLYAVLWILVDAIASHRIGEPLDAPLDAALRHLRDVPA